MAQSEAHSVSALSPSIALQAPSALGERRLRRISAWLLLFFLLQGELGAVWDREWHAFVGRDQFWTPPHTLIYSCVAGAGILALVVVLIETFRYRHQAIGVDDHSTTPIFGFFHAPLGFAVLGFGALLALCAAPLDNYWHELYGIDIALWAPFHMMGVTGGMIGILGMIYIFASEAAIERESKPTPRRYLGLTALEIGAVLAMASFLNFVLTGFLQFPLVTIGTLHIDTYPIPMITGGIFCMLGAIRLTNKAGTATLVVFLLLLHTLIVELFVPWAIRVAVVQQSLQYRIPGDTPHFEWSYAILPLVFLVSSLIVDIFAYRLIRKQGNTQVSAWKIGLLGALIAPPAFLLAPLILWTYSPYAPVFLPEAGVPIPLSVMVSGVVLAVIIGILSGVAGALMGADFGDVWRWSRR